ncbi:BTK motif domain-containing protein [Phthorimaea operculella]|nr:BTK motif domain-containing protein [Phthorimaea operculella]
MSLLCGEETYTSKVHSFAILPLKAINRQERGQAQLLWVVVIHNLQLRYSESGRRRERGRIATDTIHTVELAQLGEISKQIPDGDGEKSTLYRYPFQIGYSEQNSDYTLYLVADEHTVRLQWIHAIRTVCISNERRAQYHPGVWAARRWSCCDAEKRAAAGCVLASVLDLNQRPSPSVLVMPLPRATVAQFVASTDW